MAHSQELQLQAASGPAVGARRIRRLARATAQASSSTVKDGRHFEELAEPARHRVRKQVKRLRYLAELTRALFNGRAVDRYVASLKALPGRPRCLPGCRCSARFLTARATIPEPGSSWAGWVRVKATQGVRKRLQADVQEGQTVLGMSAEPPKLAAHSSRERRRQRPMASSSSAQRAPRESRRRLHRSVLQHEQGVGARPLVNQPQAVGQPSTNAAVDSASASSPLDATTLTLRNACGERPVAGSKMWWQEKSVLNAVA